MDYGKFKFDAAQRAKESRRKTTSTSIKEMKYRPKIGSGDFDTKTRQVARFLTEGHKVKITIMFRGRELSHQELGLRILDRVAEQVNAIGKVEAAPKVDGRNMIMVLAPDKRAQQQASRQSQRAAAGSNGADAVPADAPADAAPAAASPGENGGGNGAAVPTPVAAPAPAPSAPTTPSTPTTQES
jgi:translation initiation factor IF-3